MLYYWRLAVWSAPLLSYMSQDKENWTEIPLRYVRWKIRHWPFNFQKRRFCENRMECTEVVFMIITGYHTGYRDSETWSRYSYYLSQTRRLLLTAERLVTFTWRFQNVLLRKFGKHHEFNNPLGLFFLALVKPIWPNGFQDCYPVLFRLIFSFGRFICFYLSVLCYPF